jgi:uncharacterized integral membrane protein
MEPADPLSPPKSEPPAKRRAGMAVAAGLGALVGAFVLLNLDSVKVNWIVATTRTPLVVVMVLLLMIGFLGGAVYSRAGGGRRRRKR